MQKTGPQQSYILPVRPKNAKKQQHAEAQSPPIVRRSIRIWRRHASDLRSDLLVLVRPEAVGLLGEAWRLVVDVTDADGHEGWWRHARPLRARVLGLHAELDIRRKLVVKPGGDGDRSRRLVDIYSRLSIFGNIYYSLSKYSRLTLSLSLLAQVGRFPII